MVGHLYPACRLALAVVRVLMLCTAESCASEGLPRGDFGGAVTLGVGGKPTKVVCQRVERTGWSAPKRWSTEGLRERCAESWSTEGLRSSCAESRSAEGLGERLRREELEKLGPLSRNEKITAGALGLTVGLWIFGAQVRLC